MADKDKKDEKQAPLFSTAYIPNGKEAKDLLWCSKCRKQSVAHRCFSTFDCWVCTLCKLDHTDNRLHYKHQLPYLPAPTTDGSSPVGSMNSPHRTIGNVLIYHIDNSGTSGRYWFRDTFQNIIAAYDIKTRQLEFLTTGVFEIVCHDTNINARSSYKQWKINGATVLIEPYEVLLDVTHR